ncbi:MAG: hypothetical protein WCT85_01465 [Parachlamydiales bacterium]|jgi:hypothetical protein
MTGLKNFDNWVARAKNYIGAIMLLGGCVFFIFMLYVRLVSTEQTTIELKKEMQELKSSIIPDQLKTINNRSDNRYSRHDQDLENIKLDFKELQNMVIEEKTKNAYQDGILKEKFKN